MRILIVGRGSMSNRRQRNLKALGYNDFITWDIMDEITIEQKFDEYKPDAMIVSCPPLLKKPYIYLANSRGLNPFVEADIISYPNCNYYPSCSLRLHNGIQKIKELLDTGAIGKIYTFQYRLGQHLRDWRPKGFDFTNYYAAKHGGAEMVIFEIGWLSMLFGTPVNAVGMIDKKLQDPQIQADDIYAIVAEFSKEKRRYKTTFDENNLIHFSTVSIIGTILIDILAKPAARELTVIGEKSTLKWDWSNDYISIIYANNSVLPQGFTKGKAAEGYDKNISESMYEKEMANFIAAVQGKEEYYFSRQDEEAAINVLHIIGL